MSASSQSETSASTHERGCARRRSIAPERRAPHLIVGQEQIGTERTARADGAIHRVKRRSQLASVNFWLSSSSIYPGRIVVVQRE